MTREEFNNATKRLFVCFPGTWEWISTKSPDVKATLDVWFQTLSDCTFAEVAKVIESWVSGKREPPKAFERDLTAIVIRQSVAFDRSQQKRFQVVESLADHRRAAMQRRKDYVSPMSDLFEAFEIAKKAILRLQDGEITKADYDRILSEATK